MNIRKRKVDRKSYISRITKRNVSSLFWDLLAYKMEWGGEVRDLLTALQATPIRKGKKER